MARAARYRVEASRRLDPPRRAALGQYMTPAPIGRFMAHGFARPAGSVRVLDPGAGVGLLTAAWVERFCRPGSPLRTAQFVCYEIEPLLLDGLRRTLAAAVRQCGRAQIAVAHEVRATDFVWDAPRAGPRFREAPADAGYTHVILNPPYKKIRSTSAHRAALRQAGLETSNLYTGFLYLAAQRLRPGGEMVALVPRSFCNGPLFQAVSGTIFRDDGLAPYPCLRAAPNGLQGRCDPAGERHSA